MTRPGHPADTPDPSDPDLSAVHTAADNLGPFDTEQQVRELPAVREVYAAFDADPGVGKMAPHSLRMLLDVLAEAGVYVGRYDVRIAEWLATWEPQTVAVVAGWVQRASQADALLARKRDGPQAVTPTPGDRRTTRPRRHPDAEVICAQGNARGNDGRAPREEAR